MLMCHRNLSQTQNSDKLSIFFADSTYLNNPIPERMCYVFAHRTCVYCIVLKCETKIRLRPAGIPGSVAAIVRIIYNAFVLLFFNKLSPPALTNYGHDYHDDDLGMYFDVWIKTRQGCAAL